MDCKSVRDRFSPLLEKELTSLDEKEIREHLSSCPECRREFDQFEKTMQCLHSVEEVEVPYGFLPELNKKIEERKTMGTRGEKSTGGWFKLPISIRLPAQAVAMVAIVFLVLYLTKMMPTEVYHMKESKQTSSLPSPEQKPEQVFAQKEAEADRKVSETPAETQGLKKGVGQVEAPAAAEKRMGTSPPYMKAEGERRVLERPAEASRPKKDVDQVKTLASAKKREEAPAPQLKAEAKKEVPSPKSEIVSHQAFDLREQEKAKGPSTEPEGSGKGLAFVAKEKPAVIFEKSLVSLKPFQEIVLKISDREKVVSRLQELIKQFGGEMVTVEGNTFVASLPTGSFSGFEKEVAELGSRTEEDKLIKEKQAVGSLRAAPAAPGVRREEKSKRTADAESRVTVRILLIQE